jgi:hypothetical protein
MKRIETQTNINQLLQPLPETAQEAICGGGRPAGGGGGGGDIIVFDIVDSVASSSSRLPLGVVIGIQY